MRNLATISLLAALCGLSAASAQPVSPAVVVNVGQPLQLKSDDYGRRDIDELTQELESTVGRALARSRAAGKPVQVQLVLEDPTPNRPTSAELGHRPGLSARSIGLGGAWVDGSAVMADGRREPLSYSFYETNLRDEFGPSVWSDAGRAFDMLASTLARGKIPQQSAPPSDPHASFARWPG